MSPRRLDDDVPRLPRGKGLKLSTGQLVQVVTVAVALVAVIVLAKPCARSVSRFVTAFDTDGGPAHIDAGAPATAPEGVILRGDMTPAQLEAAIAKARAAAGPTAPIDAGASAIDAAPAAR